MALARGGDDFKGIEMESIRSAASTYAVNIKNRLASVAAIAAICLASGPVQAEFSFELTGPTSIDVGQVGSFNLNVLYSPIDLTQFNDGSSNGSPPTASFAHGSATNLIQISVTDSLGTALLPPVVVGETGSGFDPSQPSQTNMPFFAIFDVPGQAIVAAEGLTTETVNRFPTASCQVENGCFPDAILDQLKFGGFVSTSYAVNVTPVPEPETYAMLIAGLCLVGAFSHRRRQSA